MKNTFSIILHNELVKEIGLKLLRLSALPLFLNIGVTLACFQIYGRHFLLRNRLNSLVRGLYIEEVALRILEEIPSGPGGLVTLSIFNWSITSCSVIIISLNSRSGGPGPCSGSFGTSLRLDMLN